MLALVFPGQGSQEVGMGLAGVGGAVQIGADDDLISGLDDFEAGGFIFFVGVVAGESADGFGACHADLFGLNSDDAGAAVYGQAHPMFAARRPGAERKAAYRSD